MMTPPFHHDQDDIVDSILRTLQNITSQIPVRQDEKDHQFKDVLGTLPEAAQTQLKSLLLTLHFLFPHEFLPALDILDRKLITCLIFSGIERSSNTDLDPAYEADVHTRNEDQAYTRSIEKNESKHRHHHLNPYPDSTTTTTTTNHPSNLLAASKTNPTFYLVQSTSSLTDSIHLLNQRPSSSSGRPHKQRKVFNPHQIHYEVRVDSWNCTCPAFAVSSLGMIERMDLLGGHNDNNNDDDGDGYDYTNELKGVTREGNFDMTSSIEEHDSTRLPRVGGDATKSNHPVPICKHLLATVLGMSAPRLFPGAVSMSMVSKDEFVGWAAGWGEYG